MINKKNSYFVVQKNMKKLLEKGVFEGVFPCGAAGVLLGTGEAKQKIITCYGNASVLPEKRKLNLSSFFDLASLTKPLATTMAILCLIKSGKTDLSEKLPSLIEKKIKNNKKNITLKQLLAHCSGLPAHRNYFETLKDIPFEKKKIFLETLLLGEELENSPGSRVVYSDLGFMLLGLIIEAKSGCTLDRFVKENVLKPFNLEEKIFFNSLSDNRNIRSDKEYVATENCYWRKKVLTGEVHDDNCYAMGGVAGHSGLFGDIESITRYTGLILDMWKNVVVHPNIDNIDLVNFLVRQGNNNDNNRMLGFDGIDKKCSSSGRYFSEKSVGHLGFSGTSFWIDPEKETAVVLLTNRIHPSRTNIKIKQFRPYFHNKVLERIYSF